MVVLIWSGIIIAVFISIALVCNKASSPALQIWQHHTAVSERYGNDGGFTNLDATYITAAKHFKDRLLSDWLCSRNRNPLAKQRKHALPHIHMYSHTGGAESLNDSTLHEKRLGSTTLSYSQWDRSSQWAPRRGKPVILEFHEHANIQ